MPNSKISVLAGTLGHASSPQLCHIYANLSHACWELMKLEEDQCWRERERASSSSKHLPHLWCSMPGCDVQQTSGPMVYGCAYCPISKLEDLKALKCADSKTLSLAEREKLLDQINESSEFVGWEVEVLSPSFISQNMLRKAKYNLNLMSHDAAMALISRSLAAGANISQVFVDTVGPPDKYQAKLESRFPGLKITVSKKADALFPTVSAASICAKVVRDRALLQWRCPETVDIDVHMLGSGYPSDPQTKRFLSSGADPVFGFPSLVRFSWSTCATILDKSAAAVQWEKPDEGENVAVGQTRSVASFFGGARQRHVFFTDRRLSSSAPL